MQEVATWGPGTKDSGAHYIGPSISLMIGKSLALPIFRDVTQPEVDQLKILDVPQSYIYIEPNL